MGFHTQLESWGPGYVTGAVPVCLGNAPSQFLFPAWALTPPLLPYHSESR